MAEAVGGVIIDHTGCLHEGVADRGADEAEAARLEIFAHGVGLAARGGNVLGALPRVVDRAPADELPDVGVEGAELSANFKKSSGVTDGSLDLETVSNDAGVAQQRFRGL